MLETFGPDKADVIYDCAGNDISMGQAIAHARKGSAIVLVAVFSKKQILIWPLLTIMNLISKAQ